MAAYPPLTQDPDGTLHMRFSARNPQIPLQQRHRGPQTAPHGSPPRDAPDNTIPPPNDHRTTHLDNTLTQPPRGVTTTHHWQLTQNMFSHNVNALREDTVSTKRRGNIGKLVRQQSQSM